jgi:hypothetical protein
MVNKTNQQKISAISGNYYNQLGLSKGQCNPQLYFRGLLKVHSRYGPPVCCLPKVDICPQSFSREVSLSSAGTLRPRGAPIYCVSRRVPFGEAGRKAVCGETACTV